MFKNPHLTYNFGYGTYIQQIELDILSMGEQLVLTSSTIYTNITFQYLKLAFHIFRTIEELFNVNSIWWFYMVIDHILYSEDQLNITLMSSIFVNIYNIIVTKGYDNPKSALIVLNHSLSCLKNLFMETLTFDHTFVA